jgi:hypothetical protein
MRVLHAASSVIRLPVFFVEQGLSAAGAAVRLVGRIAGRDEAAPTETVWAPAEPEPVVREPEPPLVESEPPFVEPEPPFVEPEPVAVEPEPPEPVHVSEEPVLVAEVAEAGAEDGAGAELRIDEPWEGYSRMSASEIRGRLRGADAATMAAVSLYEAANKGRSTVLRAAADASATPSG